MNIAPVSTKHGAGQSVALANRARPLMSHVAAAGAISDGGTDENSKYS